jgi:hypothetical protein
MIIHTQLSIYCNDTMPERVIKKLEDQLKNNNHKNNSNNNDHHHQHYQHNNTFLSKILASILFAALIGTTGGTIALATMVGEVSSMLFLPSAEAAPVYRCDELIATIVGKVGVDDVIQGTLGDDVIVGLWK